MQKTVGCYTKQINARQASPRKENSIMDMELCNSLLAIFDIIVAGLIIPFKYAGIPGIVLIMLNMIFASIVYFCKIRIILKYAEIVLPRDDYDRLRNALIMRMRYRETLKNVKDKKMKRLIEQLPEPPYLAVIWFANTIIAATIL